ncbi:hypothetical protein EAF04_001701 [Stromatinia cepivora]|nr:hypothetical protein EAF04_001701 [Stromatinia cepivora]
MMQKPSDFHQFQYLPKEIRLQIWSKLIPPPRIIQLSSRENPHNSPLVSLTKPPILLSINHESRTLGFSTYSLLPIRNVHIPISRIEDTVYVSFAQLHYG